MTWSLTIARVLGRLAIVTAVTFGAVAPFAPAVAAAGDPALAQNGGTLPSDEIIAQIRAVYAGKPIGQVEGPLANGDGTLRYGIKWLTPDGHVLFIVVDARSGAIIDVQGGQ